MLKSKKLKMLKCFKVRSGETKTKFINETKHIQNVLTNNLLIYLVCLIKYLESF